MGNTSSFPFLKPRADNNIRDWARLPDELVGSIAERLPAPEHVRARAVCTTWFTTVGSYTPNSAHFPWLMLEESGRHHCFFSLLDTRSYSFKSSGGACLGFRDGCLVILNTETSEIRLVNPIAEFSTRLPFFNTFSLSKTFFDIRKIAVSSTASIALVYSLSSCHLAFARPGSDMWVPLDFLSPPLSRIEDVAYHEGKFYILYTYGEVQFFDMAGHTPIASKLYGTPVPLQTPCRSYLVPCSENLLRVQSITDKVTGTITNFSVTKFDTATKHCWVEMKSLGDMSLFLDSKYSLSLSTKFVGDIRRNCIYFADYLPHSSKVRLGDLKIFDMEKCRMKKLPVRNSRIDDAMILSSPIWFIPSVSK